MVILLITLTNKMGVLIGELRTLLKRWEPRAAEATIFKILRSFGSYLITGSALNLQIIISHSVNKVFYNPLGEAVKVTTRQFSSFLSNTSFRSGRSHIPMPDATKMWFNKY